MCRFHVPDPIHFRDRSRDSLLAVWIVGFDFDGRRHSLSWPDFVRGVVLDRCFDPCVWDRRARFQTDVVVPTEERGIFEPAKRPPVPQVLEQLFGEPDGNAEVDRRVRDGISPASRSVKAAMSWIRSSFGGNSWRSTVSEPISQVGQSNVTPAGSCALGGWLGSANTVSQGTSSRASGEISGSPSAMCCSQE